MAENVVDALLVTFGIDNSEYVHGVDEAVEKTREFSEKAPREAEHGLKSIEQKFGATFQGIFRSFIAPLTAALGATGLFSQYTAAADRIGKTAKRIGMDAQELQAWGEAAKRAGGSTEGFMHSVESLNFRLSRMQLMGGKGPLAKLFGDLHISATENGRLKDTFQILRELAGAMDKMDEAGKVELGKKLKIAGIDPGTIALLQMGRISMDDLIKRQRDLGVYTEEDFKITTKFNDSLSDLQQVFKALAAVILRVVVPPITAITKAMTVVIKTFREHQGFIVAGLLVISGVLSGVLLKAVTALGAALAPLLAPIAAIAALGLIFDEIAVYAEGGQTALEGLWKAIGTPEDFRAVGKAAQDFGKELWDATKSIGKELGGGLVNALKNAFEKIDTNKFAAGLKKTWDSFVKMAERVGKLFSGIVKAVGSIFEPSDPGGGWSLLDAIIDGISSALSTVSDVAEGVFNFVGSVAEYISSILESDAFSGLKGIGSTVGDLFATAIGVGKELFGLIGDIVKSVVSLFSPEKPSGEWSVLRGIIDGIAEVIKLMVGWVTDLLNAVKRVIQWIRSWGGNSEEEENKARTQILGQQTEDQYVAAEAQKLKSGNPSMSDAEAQTAAKKQLDKKIDQQVAATRVQDSYDLALFEVGLGGMLEQAPQTEPKSENPAPVAKQAAVTEPPAPAPTPAEKPEVKPAPAPVVKPAPKSTPAPKPAVKPAPAAQAAPAPKTAAKPAAKPAPAQAAKPTAKPAAPKAAQKGGDGLAGTVKSILDVLLTISANVGSLGAVAAKIPDMGSIAQTYNTRNEQNNRYETRIETINVNAPAATNAEGIAREFPAAIRNRTPNLASANAGVFGS